LSGRIGKSQLQASSEHPLQGQLLISAIRNRSSDWHTTTSWLWTLYIGFSITEA